MIKNIIAPLQSWLLSQNRCVGCGMPLAGASHTKSNSKEVVTCKCKRVYIYDKAQKSYRRALLSEI